MKVRLIALPLVLALGSACSDSRNRTPDAGSNSGAPASSYSTGVPMAPASFAFSARQNGPIPPLVAGAVRDIAFVFKNESSLPWPARSLAETDKPMGAAYHILDPNGDVFMFEGFRSLITADVPPGHELVIELHVKAPDKPGRYLLQPDVLQETVSWFGMTPPRKNNPPVPIDVIVPR
jgi:hypothetical protein